jgi:DNA-binding transcriptional LysR family regulator
MLFGQIQAFLEVARTGNVSRAAESLYVTQPALTARIQALEKDLNESLFVRTGRGVRLTDAGRAFLPNAERAIQSIEDGRQALTDLRSASAGRLALGAAPAVSTYVLPPVLKRFAALHPRVDVAVRTGHSEEILAMVLNDEVQVGLVRTIRHPDIEAKPLYDDELVLVSNPSHRFARRGAVSLAEVGRERLIMFDRTSSYFELTQSLFLRAGLMARTVMELDNIEAAKKMVEEGLGVALLPMVSVAREIGTGVLSAIQILDAPPVTRSIDAIRRKDSGTPGGVVKAFLEELEATLRAREARALGR